MGTQEWVISGGEPMIHPEFPDIFEYIISRSIRYSLNTNGTLITPQIAKLMKKKGSKMVAIYGADSKVHDMVTGHPGSFDMTMRGFSILKESGVGFTVQVIPMNNNYHQLDKMIDLAKKLSPSYRIGTSWLFYSACRSEVMNKEIEQQRLTPEEVVSLDPPLPGYEAKYRLIHKESNCSAGAGTDDRLFQKCITTRNSFHIDPYGKMTFCSFVKDSQLRFDLKNGSFSEGWDEFIPSLADKVRGGEEYLKNCGSCEKRDSCSWCAVYSWLEHGRYSAPVKYLCDITDEKIRYKKDWNEKHTRYYKIGGVTVQISSDIPFKDDSFLPKLEKFRVKNPGDDIILIRYHFQIPDMKDVDLGEEIYRKIPWAIYRKNESWIYKEILDGQADDSVRRVVVFNKDHTIAEIYLRDSGLFTESPNHALSLFPSDQLLLSRIFADRNAITIHASGMIINGAGLIFTGKSGAGKSTIATLLKNEGELLCDEFMIIREWEEGFRIHGTWSHGDIPEVSNGEAPMKALLFLEKSDHNRLEKLTDTKEIVSRLVPRLMQPLVTTDWWEKSLTTIEKLVKNVPAYLIRFDKSGEIRSVIRDFTGKIDKKWK